jgi:tetratricopeptide (TPR) repeat protein
MTNEAVVFLSYAHSSNLGHATALEAALRTAGIETFRDETEIADGEPFPEAILDALLGSRVVVLFGDPIYFEREYCRWEFEAALAPLGREAAEGRSASLDHIVVARPAVRGVSDELERLPPAVRSRQWPSASETARLVDLVQDRLARRGPTLAERLGPIAGAELRGRLLEGSRVPLPTLPGPVPRFPSVIPVSLRDAFVGRSEVLWRIDYLLRTRYGTPDTTRSTVGIEGGGGIGKTRVALEFVHRYGHNYPGGLFWVDAGTSPDGREEQLFGVLRALRPGTPALVELRKNSVDVAARVADALSDLPTRAQVLYVIDNLPEVAPGTQPEPIRNWCPAPGHVSLLITSRQQVSLAEGISPIALPELSAAAAISVLTQNVDRSSLRVEDWASITDWVGQLPLALVLLNAALRAGSLSAGRLRELAIAQAGTTEALDRQIGALRGHATGDSLRGVTEAFALSCSLLSPEAQHLARLIAHLAPDPLPQALLDALGDNLAPPEARAALVARSFVAPVSGTDVSFFGRMHRVLADFLGGQSSNPEAELRELLGPLLTILDEAALEDAKAWPLVNATSPHAGALAVAIDRLEREGAAVVGGSELKARIAITRGVQGDLAGARKLHEEVLAARQRTMGRGHADTLAAANNLAVTLALQGEFAQARALQEEVLTAQKRILGPDHPNTLSAASNLANTVEAQGDFAGARALQEEVLAARTRILGPDHPDALAAVGNLASTYFSQGDFAGARALQEGVLTARKRILGPEHPNTLLAAGNLASTLRSQGDLAGARALQEEVLAALRRILGPDHPDTLAAAGNLANTRYSQGELAGSRVLQEEVFAARKRILGPDHPDTVRAAGNLANVLALQGDLAGARTLQEEVLTALRRILGPEHPATLAAAGNLASTLYLQGDLPGARRLQEEVLAAFRRILGPEHPNTLRAERNLGIFGG